MRVYLPTTLPALADMLDRGEIAPAPLNGYGVTPTLREAYAAGDEEELEYVAMLAAARESLRKLALSPEAPRRRVVLAADVPDADVTWIAYDDEAAALVISAVVPLSAIAAGHVDDESAVSDIAAAASASPAADAGDEDAQFTVDGAEGHELGWYATQELFDLGLNCSYGCRDQGARAVQRAGSPVPAGKRRPRCPRSEDKGTRRGAGRADDDHRRTARLRRW